MSWLWRYSEYVDWWDSKQSWLQVYADYLKQLVKKAAEIEQWGISITICLKSDFWTSLAYVVTQNPADFHTLELNV